MIQCWSFVSSGTIIKAGGMDKSRTFYYTPSTITPC